MTTANISSLAVIALMVAKVTNAHVTQIKESVIQIYALDAVLIYPQSKDILLPYQKLL